MGFDVRTRVSFFDSGSRFIDIFDEGGAQSAVGDMHFFNYFRRSVMIEGPATALRRILKGEAPWPNTGEVLGENAGSNVGRCATLPSLGYATLAWVSVQGALDETQIARGRQGGRGGGGPFF